MLRLFPILTLVLMIAPVASGVIGTLLPAFGFLPTLGGDAISLAPWRDLFAQPGIGRSVQLSAVTGLVATFVSVWIVFLFCAGWQGTRVFRWMQRALSPILSIPHATAAFGLAFLIAPSGWIARVIAQMAGSDRPVDMAIIHDPYGLAMIAGLVIKEVPFLFLMTLAALPQVDTERTWQVTATLGYGRVAGWCKATLPRVYRQIRLPVLAVLAYSASVVDVAMILGPTTPAPLAVRILGWLSDPDLSFRFVASSGAVLQLVVVIGVIGIWMIGERIVSRVGLRWVENGRRCQNDGAIRQLGAVIATLTTGTVIFGLVILLIWSMAGFWAFPDLLPRQFSLRLWDREFGAIARGLVTTLLIGLPAVVISAILVMGCLENQNRYGVKTDQKIGLRMVWWIYIPLLVPQISFMFGLQVFFTGLGLERTVTSVVVAHLVFVLPYVFLSLSDPYRSLDPRYGVVALCLGASPARVFWKVRLPMLLRAVVTAMAVGLAVSVGQYLPTLLIGAGRFATVTTEAVALASGGDRRMIGIYGLLQMVLPFVGFALAMIVPTIVFRNRRGMRPADRE
ncbi:ABC transporter permease subunit [Thalassospira sp. MA62]|nr:ABC transporter permease subunit [Thalassospira sp. MA62]